MLFRSLLAVCFFGVEFAKVLIEQGSLQEKHEVGASAILYCNVTADTEILTRCKMVWEIWNEPKNSADEIPEIPHYHNRVNVRSQGTTSSLTIRDLKVTDSEEILCTAKCYVDGELQHIHGDGTILTVSETSNKEKKQEEKAELSWLKYLIFSINCLILGISMLIFIMIIQKRGR